MKKIMFNCKDGSVGEVELTEEEITAMQVAQSDWLHNYPMRIVAPKMLALTYPQIYIWFQINDLPIEKVGDMVHLYCNEIMEEHQSIINDNLELITVELRP